MIRYLFFHVRATQLLLGFGVLLRVSVKLLFAHGCTEVVGLPFVFSLPLCSLLINLHIANYV